MRVVMVSKALVVGAYQRKLEELAQVPGVELTALVPPSWREGRSRQVLDRAHTAGYDLVEIPIAFNGRFHLHYYPTLGTLLQELRPDILHMDEEPYNLATWHALRLAAAAGTPSLFFTWQNLERTYPFPIRLIEAANYKRAAYAIAGNQDAAEVLRSKGYRGRLTVIPQFGVDPSVFSPGETPPAARPFTIGYAGRLVPEKGIDLLLRACAELPSSGWELLLAGNGPSREHFEALALTLKIHDRVQFLGQIPSTQITDYYRRLDLFVLPSVTRPNWVEQFGRVLMEAMACGVPVIGSDSGEIPQVIGKAGLIFPEQNAGALRELMASLMHDPARRAHMAACGRERVLAQFTQRKIARATWEVYQDILSGPNRSTSVL